MAAPQIYIGTSGWSYPSGYGAWKGIFYPRRWGGDELAYYAERFPAVEVNATFYRIPAPQAARRWAEVTPETFRFAVKLFRKFTHPQFYEREEAKSPEITPEDVAGMRVMLDELAMRDRLGAMLVQYPDFFFRNPDNESSLVRTLDYFRAYPLAVELRNRSWQNARTREILSHFHATYVRLDEPLFNNLDDPGAPAEGLLYWRFHGRNAETWRKRGAGHQRYDYLYTAEEVDSLAELVEKHMGQGGQQFAFFNNHPGGKAAANAVQLAARLKQQLPYGKFANLAETFPELLPITGSIAGTLGLEE